MKILLSVLGIAAGLAIGAIILFAGMMINSFIHPMPAAAEPAA